MSEPVGPTEHLDTPEYWRELYTFALHVGQDVVTAIRGLHYQPFAGPRIGMCDECQQEWPCKTIRVLEQAQGGGGRGRSDE